MTYFLGRDVNVNITTESISGSVSGNHDSAALSGVQMAGYPAGTNVGGGGDTYIIIPPRSIGIDSRTRITDVTGIDFSPGTITEDLSYMGQNTNLTAEIKKEFVITVTRKVSDGTFDMLYNYARDGVYNTGGADATGGTWTINDGLTTSKNQNFGYRLYVTFKDGTEVMAVPNCCVTAHTHTVTPDASQEETIEFYGYVQPILVSGTATTDLVALTAASAI
tara:strand:- start:977 stop:1639 length:663 start_codon:yes stop_codon:yes gene_type:complete